MRILLVGSGGREHALAWKLAHSPRLEYLWIAPGNGGTAALDARAENVAIGAEDLPALTAFARRQKPDLIVIGPEAPLALGLADELRGMGLAVFGPSQAAARIEASKAFAKAFMARHGIPTARSATFTSFEAASAHLGTVAYPIVIKASGLAAGKGVLLPADRGEAEAALRTIMVDRVFGDAGAAVVIEERLSGPEVSLLAFADGAVAAPMPPAQDHKRAFDGDQGPNTGGMGAFAPSPLAPPALVAQVMRTVVQPAIDGLRMEGCPFVGVLYAGLMLTADGPRVLEFNCRFGDPETQVILPLLESDLVDVLEACVQGRLSTVPLRWLPGAAATVVLTSGGYPGPYERGKPISGVDDAAQVPGAIIFHAGTQWTGDILVTSGGRVLNVSAVGDTLPLAVERAYEAAAKIHFQGMHYRRDIGRGREQQ